MKLANILIFTILLITSPNLFASELHGVSFTEKVKLNGQDLVLNGMGTRKATFFRVKVYVAGLYLKEKSNDPKKIADMAGPKKIKMQFLMGVDRKKLTDAWSKAVSEHCPADCTEVKKGISTINSYMKSVRKKDRFEFDMLADRVLVKIKGVVKDPIMGKDFSKALLKVYIGPKEIDKGMAKSLLGEK